MSYSDQHYLATLGHLGERLDLPQSGSAVYLRAIGTRGGEFDALGPYPWLTPGDETTLADELASVVDAQAISTVAVLSPLRGEPSAALKRAFGDHLRPFKTHWYCDFRRPLSVDAHHRRQLRRAQAALEFAIQPAATLVDAFPQLYAMLGERHVLSPAARFTEDALRDQLQVPGLIAFVARLDGEPIAAQIWLPEGEWMVYHLGASSPAGYRHAASHGLMATAIEHFRDGKVRGLWLGGCAGTGDDPADGLARYKRGWANDEAPAWIAGRVGQRLRYRALCQGPLVDDYFPIYRAPKPVVATRPAVAAA